MSPLLKGETLEGCTAPNHIDCTKEELLELAKISDDAKLKEEGDYIHFSDESLGVDFTILVSPETGRLFLFETREGTRKLLAEQAKGLREWKATGLHPDLYHNDGLDDIKMIEQATEWFRANLVHFFNGYPTPPKQISVQIESHKGAELKGKVDPGELV